MPHALGQLSCMKKGLRSHSPSLAQNGQLTSSSAHGTARKGQTILTDICPVGNMHRVNSVHTCVIYLCCILHVLKYYNIIGTNLQTIYLYE